MGEGDFIIKVLINRFNDRPYSFLFNLCLLCSSNTYNVTTPFLYIRITFEEKKGRKEMGKGGIRVGMKLFSLFDFWKNGRVYKGSETWVTISGCVFCVLLHVCWRGKEDWMHSNYKQNRLYYRCFLGGHDHISHVVKCLNFLKTQICNRVCELFVWLLITSMALLKGKIPSIKFAAVVIS